MDNYIDKTSRKTTNGRSIFFDNYKGILILLVVFGHFLYDMRFVDDIFNVIAKIIYIFHMPAFVLISGYFSKSEFNSRKLFRLSFYYVGINTILMLLNIYLFHCSPSLLSPFNSLWYLLSLIIWRLIVKHVSKVRWIIPISFIVALLIGFWPDVANILSLKRVFAFFPFFIVGYKLNEEAINNFLKSRNSLFKIIGSILLIVCILFSYFYVTFTNFNDLLMDPYYKATRVFHRIILFPCFFTDYISVKFLFKCF
jgi:fucose 4-O-acetylase-like acetyltransferase